MRSIFLTAFAVALATALSAQSSSSFFSTFDAERGSVVAPARDGNLWLGGQKDERVLLAKLTPEGKVLDRHSVGFEGAGLDLEHLTDLFEESDGTLVGCGDFEGDNLRRGFVFRYNPASGQTLWAHIVRSGSINYLLGITELGPGGDYVLYGQTLSAGNRDAELLLLDHNTGLIIPGKASRIDLGLSDRFSQLVYHDGALYACGHFTEGFGFDGYGRTRSALCQLDTATLQPVWSYMSPLPATVLANLQGRDLIVDNDALVSTFSGSTTDPDLFPSTIFLQKNTLAGHLLWVRQYDLPEWTGEFAEEIISLPDGYLLYGHDLISDTSRLFLLKTDKDGNAQWARKIVYDYNDELSDFPARSKIIRAGDALFFTALSQNAVGQTQGILVKTNLNGAVNDSCAYLQTVAVFPVPIAQPVNEAVVPAVFAGTATQTPATVSINLPDLNFSKKCGAAGTCSDLPDLRVTLDSITCNDGDPRLYFTVCNVGGQPYDGPSTLFLYDQNPLTGPAKLITGSIGGGLPLPPGECVSWGSFGSDVYFQMPYELDTFTQLYALIGANYTVSTPIPISGFPYPPNRPECSYLNNLDSISIPPNLCGDCEKPVTFVKKLGAPQRRELASGMCAASDGNVYVAGKQDDNPMIAKITTRGEEIWVRNFPPIHPNEPIEWASIIEDSDGMLVLCGTEGASPSNRRAVAMRYDPTLGTVLWYKRYQSAKPTGTAIVEKGPGGNFVLSSNYQTTGSGGVSAFTEYLTLNRVDGNTTGSNVSYQSLSHNIVIANTVLNNGSLYSAGSWITKTNDEARPFFAKISPSTFLPEWANISVSDTAKGAARWMTPADVAFDGDIAVIAGSGHPNPLTPTENIFVFLEKRYPDGSLEWVKRYDMQMAPEEVLILPNAYIVFGRMAGANQFGMLKTDANGNVLQARVLTAAPATQVSVGGGARQNLILSLPLQLLMLDHTWEPDESDLVLVRTDLNFGLDDACDLLQDVQVNSQTLAAVTEQAVFGIGTNTPAPAALPANAVFQADSLPLRKLCPTCADSPPCTDKPDITFQIESVGCDSAAFVSYRLCNIGAAPYSGPLEVAVYESNPLTGAAILLDQFTFQVNDLPSDSCQTGSLKNLSYWGNYTKVYTLAGIESGQTTPVDPAGFPYNGIAECDYTNNLDNLSLQYPSAPQKPDLGPDRILCAGDSLLLDAGAGFVSYHWSNSLTTRAISINTTGVYILETTDACGRILSDTVAVTILSQPAPTTLTIQLYPGDTVFLAGTPYTQPDTVVQTLLTANGCDSVVTTILQLVITTVDLTCPANLTVPLPANQSSINLTYPLPAASTDCPDPDIALTLLQGLPVGGAFPPGNTLVCYEAADQCGARDTCCFMVAIQPEAEETACDVKNPPGSCIKYELLGIRLDSLGRPRYRMRLTNTCASPLRFAYFQTPNGTKAQAPADGAIYTAPGGNTYLVRNPNATPYHSIRFKAVSGSLNNGKSDIFEYTLPRQAQPVFILVSAGLEDGSTSRAHINTFGCPVQPYEANQQEPTDEAQYRNKATTAAVIQVRPNPTTGLLLVETPAMPEESVLISVLNAQGQLVMERRYTATGNTPISLELPEELADGLYHLRVRPAAGAPATTRFVLARTAN